MFELDNVSKRFGDTVALAPTKLKISPGKTTVLIGPSGSGKSTLIRLLIGLVKPDHGVIRYDGQMIGDNNINAMRQKVGFVVQEGGLFPHMTATANVTLMARQLGWDTNRIKTRLFELAQITRFPLEGLQRYPAQLSGGQRQRVSLMRALMLNPEALLLDEPLGALDPMIRFELQDDLKFIFRTLGKTVVIVTHDINEAGFFADLIVLMRAGRIIQYGTLEDIAQKPVDHFVERFIRVQRSPFEFLK